jgi:formylglycine-generating enzyme required for sulfatase activity
MVAAVIALLAGAALVLMRTLGIGPGAGQAESGEQTAVPTLPPTPTATATALPTLTPLPSATPLQAAPATPVPPVVFAPLEAGSSAYRFVDGAVLQFVPSGTFVMGAAGRYAQLDEQPQHTVMLSDFWIDRTEVTNAQYALCVADGLCAPPSNRRFFDDPVFAGYPVIYVPHSSAVTYCLWAARATGTATGLPTEAQWEKAAAWDPAAETTRTYPWGDDPPTDDLARFQGNTTAGIAPAGSLPAGASPYGALDMAGNVWEWVADWYGETTYNRSGVPIDPTGPQSGTQRVMRGGGWYDDFTGVRSAARGVGRPELTSIDLGFRCAMNARRPDSASGVVLAPLDLAQALVAYLPQARADAANNPAALDEWDAALNALELALQSGDNAAALALVTQRLERLDTQEESDLLAASVVYRLQNALAWLQQQLGAGEQ